MHPTIKVLIIDDDPAFRFLTRNALTRCKEPISFEISEADNGEKALKLLTDPVSIANIILLDLEMPHMSGIGFLQKYSKLNFDLQVKPVIYILSAAISIFLRREYETQEDSLKGLVTGLFTKPLDQDHIRTILANYKFPVSA